MSKYSDSPTRKIPSTNSSHTRNVISTIIILTRESTSYHDDVDDEDDDYQDEFFSIIDGEDGENTKE